MLDLFGGSGSTLIACERRKRKARLMELDPVYADVIIRRWEHYAGQKATLEGDGRSHDEIAKERLQKTEEQIMDGVGESNSGRISEKIQ